MTETHNRKILIAGVFQLVAGVILTETFKNTDAVIVGRILIITALITEVVAYWNKSNFKWLAIMAVMAAGFLLYALV